MSQTVAKAAGKAGKGREEPDTTELIRNVCDATGWPEEDAKKALIENHWNSDQTVSAILDGLKRISSACS
jgi:hypothetical protein